MKAVFTVRAPLDQLPPWRHDRPAGEDTASEDKVSYDGRMREIRALWTVRGFLLLQITIFLMLVTIHFGLLIDSFRHRAVGTTELVITSGLVLGLLLTWAPSWSQRVAIAAQSLGILGVLVGLVTVALGIRPWSILDLSLNVVLLLILVAGLASTKRGAGRMLPERMV